MYEMVGTVKKVGETVTNGRGYAHRDLVLVEERNGGFRPNIVPFTFQGDRAARLDGLAAGTRVQVKFVVDGWEWNAPTGDVKVCSKLVGLDVAAQPAAQPSSAAPSAPEPVSPGAPSTDGPDGGLPF